MQVLAERRVARQLAPLRQRPVRQVVEQWPGADPALGGPLLCRPAADLGVDRLERGNALQSLSIVDDFVSNPFVEQAHSSNVGSTGQELTPVQEAILERLQDLYPPNTRFGNYWLMVRQVLGSTGVRDIASIPIGVVIKNWKEL